MAKIIFYQCYRCAGKTLEEHQEKFKSKVRHCVVGYCDACDKTVGYASELYPVEFKFKDGFHYKLIRDGDGQLINLVVQERNIYD